MLSQLKKEMQSCVNKEKAAFFPRFFKAGKGEYGEGDKFLGVVVPDQRRIAKKYREISLTDVQQLLKSAYHEHRLTGFLILVYKFQKGDEKEKKKVYDFFIKNRLRANNWDLVDSSAPYISGPYLFDKDRSILFKYARSKNLWEKRIAMLSTFYFIKQNDFADALKIAEILVYDEHDLIHKAVGWMLREIGNRDRKVEEKFLEKYHKTMPRTMLRYAIEKFEEKKRKKFMGR